MDRLLTRKNNLVKYYESLLQNSADIIFTLDQQGYILKFNQGAEKELKYQQHEVLGKSLKDLLFQGVQEDGIFKELEFYGSIVNRELIMKTKPGDLIYVNISIAAMRNEEQAKIGHVAICKNITEKKKLEEELIKKNQMLEELAITDPLSGLYNRRHFKQEFQKTQQLLRRKIFHSLGLLLIDIDHFKELNDTLGHQAGDRMIHLLGEIILKSIRKDIDEGFRYGGDEFLVLLPEGVETGTPRVAERILQYYNAQKNNQTSLSIGIASASEEMDEKTLLEKADMAMYQAKRAGGNRFVVERAETV